LQIVLMATVIDFGFAEFFVPLFSMIFIFLIVYAILQKTEMLGGKQVTDFAIALFLSILVLFSNSALELTKFMAVWLVVILVILVFMILAFSFWSGDSHLGFDKDLDIKGILFWVMIIVLAIGLTQVFGPVLTPYASGADPSRVVLRTLFHPRVIGAVILLIIVSNLAKLLKHEA